MSLKIVVADDDLDICELLDISFRKAGFTVRTAIDGMQAFDEIVQERPDIVVLDVVMPKMSGVDVVKMMRKDDDLREIPAILVSARGQDLEFDFDLEVDRVEFVVKPFNLQELVQLVKDIVALN
jgi:DNA-binding response OmpR family regulator